MANYQQDGIISVEYDPATLEELRAAYPVFSD